MKRNRLSDKEIEIVNLSISIAAGCQPCTKYHIKKCKKTEISNDEIHDVIKKTQHIYNNAIEIMTTKAFAELNNKNYSINKSTIDNTNRIDTCIGIAVSYTVNNTTLFKDYLSLADNLGITKKEILEIIEITKFIYAKAKAHVDLLFEKNGMVKPDNEMEDCSPECKC
jgi:AhpD family alkylhydroperoxidase